MKKQICWKINNCENKSDISFGVDIPLVRKWIIYISTIVKSAHIYSYFYKKGLIYTVLSNHESEKLSCRGHI